MKKITPFLWFNTEAQEAARFYTSVFKNSRIIDSNPMSTSFELEGQEFIALNGGPEYKFTEAISFFVDCTTQEEIDYYWEKLIDGGEAGRCGWLKDKYGLSWQIVPSVLGSLLNNKDPKKSKRVMDVMLTMNKLDIRTLENA